MDFEIVFSAITTPEIRIYLYRHIEDIHVVMSNNTNLPIKFSLI